MPISSLSAARYLGGLSGWSKTNLELQKILYIAHMIHLGRQNAPLVENNFQAWYLGPVLPDLYHEAKIYGANPVQDIFFSEDSLEKDSPESTTLADTYSIVKNFSGSRLIAITHCDYGAWSKNYKPNERHVIIPNEDILEEYHQRVKRASKHSSERE